MMETFWIEEGELKEYNGTDEALVIPEGVVGIAPFVFVGHKEIKTITIPSSLQWTIGNPFDGCTGITTFIVHEANPTYHVAGNCLIETQEKNLVAGCNTSIIPTDGSVKTIDMNAFSCCDALTSFVIPEGIEVIESKAFSRCTALTSISIPDSVTVIGSSAFAFCRELTSITLPAHLFYISANAFCGCTGLTSIVIPKSVQNISFLAFHGCTNLTTIYCEAECQPEGWSAHWKHDCDATVVWGYQAS